VNKPMQIFLEVALIAILAMLAYQTSVIASVINAFENVGTALEAAFGVGTSDVIACATVDDGSELNLETADEAYGQADVGSDLEAALKEWRITPSNEVEQQIRDICAAVK
jgi:hypothetical protein